MHRYEEVVLDRQDFDMTKDHVHYLIYSLTTHAIVNSGLVIIHCANMVSFFQTQVTLAPLAILYSTAKKITIASEFILLQLVVRLSSTQAKFAFRFGFDISLENKMVCVCKMRQLSPKGDSNFM